MTAPSAAEELAERHRRQTQAVARIARSVANETNGPLQFVESNLRFVQASIEAAPGGEDAKSALAQALRGLTRVAASLRAMQHFAEPANEGPRLIDLNAALRLSLLLSRHEIALAADLETDFGEVPPVACCASDLHEIFLCLLLEAASAVGQSGRRGQVRVTTRAEGGQAIVSICDSASRDPGAPHGEGLSLARALAIRHQGQLSLGPPEGSGTAWCVRLPLAERGSERRSDAA